MYLQENDQNSIAGTLITIVLAAITVTEVETVAKILAAIAATAASCVTIYYSVKNNKAKHREKDIN